MRQGFPRAKAWSQDIPRDTIPAMMRPGEGVLVPEATQAMGGARGINFINRAAERGALNVRFPRRPMHFQDGGTVPLVQPQARIERYSLTGRMPGNEEFSDNSSLQSLAHPKTDIEYKLLQPGQLYIDPDDHKVYRKGYAQPTVI